MFRAEKPACINPPPAGTRNDKQIGVKNGVLGTVSKLSEGKITVELDGEEGNRCEITFDPCHYRSFDHGYAVTIHKSQHV